MKKNTVKREMNDQQRAMVVENIGYAETIARSYQRKGVLLDDLKQEACEALCRAAMRFDPNKGCTLATYAAVFINGWLCKYIMRCCQYSYLSGKQRVFVRVMSLEKLLCNAEDEELNWEEVLGSDDADVEETADSIEMYNYIMSRLTESEKEIVSKHLGLDRDPLPLNKIAMQMGINRGTMASRWKEIKQKMAGYAEDFIVEQNNI